MKQLLEFLPLVLFFGAYQMDGEIVTVGSWSHTFDGIFSATAVLMISSIVWLLASALSRQKERRLMWMAIAVVVFGAATLILRDQRFIQWKPTVLNWVLAAVFLGSQCVGERNLPQRLLGGQLSLTRRVWTQLNAMCIGNFTAVGALNLVVAYRYEEAFWVSYKFYSPFGFSVVVVLLAFLIVAPHLQEHEALKRNQAGGS